MPAAFSSAPEVKEIADVLIPEYFAHLQEHRVRMVYLFRDDKPYKNGKAVLGTARKVGGLSAFLAQGYAADSLASELATQGEETLRPCDACNGTGEQQGQTCNGCLGTGQVAGDPEDTSTLSFFVITITGHWWTGLDEKKRKALVHHELCHCGAKKGADGATQLFIISHDLEEFRAVVELYGLWMPDVEQMGEAFSKHVPQLRLLDEEDLTPDIVVRTRDRDVVITGEAIRAAAEVA